MRLLGFLLLLLCFSSASPNDPQNPTVAAFHQEQNARGTGTIEGFLQVRVVSRPGDPGGGMMSGGGMEGGSGGSKGGEKGRGGGEGVDGGGKDTNDEDDSNGKNDKNDEDHEDNDREHGEDHGEREDGDDGNDGSVGPASALSGYPLHNGPTYKVTSNCNAGRVAFPLLLFPVWPLFFLYTVRDFVNQYAML